jgi:hypothetical protein
MVVDAKGTAYDRLEVLSADTRHWLEPVMAVCTGYHPVWWLWTAGLAFALLYEDANNIDGGW